MKKKKLLTLGAVALISTLAFSFVGCSKPISLEDAFLNTSKAKSVSFNLTAEKTSPISGAQNLSLKGDIETGDNPKIFLNLNTKETGSISLIVNSDANKNTHLYLENSGILAQFINLPKEIKYIYLNSKELEEMSQTTTQSQTNVPNNDDVKQVISDFTKVYLDYISTHKDIAKFIETEGESKDKGGTYELTVTDTNLKEILTNYINNDTYFENLKKLTKSASLIEGEQKAPELNKEEMLKDLENIKPVGDALTVKIKIEAKKISNISFSVNSPEKQETLTLSLSLSNYDNVPAINIPSPDSKDVMNLTAILKEMMKMNQLPQ
ncbi:MAG: hypothetical protein ACRC2K_12585 [Clostridium sp.]